VAACALAVFLGGCADRGTWDIVWKGKASVESRGILEVSDGDGSLRFARRLDGNIAHARRLALAGRQDQILVVMGHASGGDQSKILLLDERGRTVAEYRNSGFCPWDEPAMRTRTLRGGFRHRQDPKPESVFPFAHRGRQFLAVGTHGMFHAPSVLVVLELMPHGQLEERLVFWNSGTIHKVAVRPPYLAFLGWSNHLVDQGQYTPVIATFHLDDVLRTECARGQSPSRGTGGVVKGAPYRAFLRPQTDRGMGSGWDVPRFEGQRLIATTNENLRYFVDAATGAVEVEALEPYPAIYERAREKDPDLPALDAHLAQMKAGVFVWTGA
jgi:hypothetical protein